MSLAPIRCALVAAACLCLGGCEGIVSFDGEGDGEGPVAGEAPPPSFETECDDDEPAHLGGSPLRRLSRTEYRNTVRDLFAPVGDLPDVDAPHDETSDGFENDASRLVPSELHVTRWEQSARTLARHVATEERWRALVDCSDVDEVGCGQRFVDEVGRRAFRRPLTERERTRFSSFFEEKRAALSLRAAVELTLQAMLQSPQFLYRLELGDRPDGGPVQQVTGFEMASRLSYFLWGTMPDEALFGAAERGELRTSEQLEAQARRMLDHPNARRMARDFHRQWLDLDRIAERADIEERLDIDDALYESMREEAYRFIEHILFEGRGTLEALLTAETTFVDARMAEHYGVSAPAEGWAETTFPAEDRAGVLSLPLVLASHGHSNYGSPVLRGLFVIERVLCGTIPPPPDDVDTTVPEPDPDMGPTTNRQRFAEKTSPAECAHCHERMNGIGFALEHYDSAGRFRETDNGLPVDASGWLANTDVDGDLSGAQGLADRLARSEQVRQCVTEQWYRFAHGREPTAADSCQLQELDEEFASSGGSFEELVVSIVTSEEFRHREVNAP